MADINDFISKPLVDRMIQLNDLIITAGNNIDQKLLPAIQKLETEQSKLSKNTTDSANATKNLTEVEKQAAATAKQLATTEAKLLSLQKGQQDALIKTKTELQKNTKATKDLQRAQSAQRGSTEQLAAVNVILEKRLRNVNQATDKGKKSADRLRSAIDKNNKKITEQSSALTKQKRGIGGYSAGIQDAASKTGFFSRELTIISRIQATLTVLTQKKTAAENASTVATTLGSKALNVFKIALISTGVGALIVALGSLVAFFKASEEGAASLARIMSPLKILFGNIKDLAITFGKTLANAFENPKEAVAGLWEAIKQNLLNRVTGIIDVFKFLGKTIQSALDLDWEGVKSNAAKAGESLVQAMTGVDDAVGKATKAVKSFAEETKKENEQNKQLVNERLALIKRERSASIDLANLEVEIQNNRLKLKDEENLSEVERLAFAVKAQEQINEQSKIQEELSAKRLAFRKLENSFSTSSQEDLDAEAALQVELINVQAANAKKLLRIESEKQTILKRINAERIADTKGVGDQLVAIKVETDNKEIELEVDKLKRLNEVREKAANDATDKEIQRVADEEAAKQEIRDAAVQLVTESIDTIFALRQGNIQKEFEALQLQKEAELANENLTAEQKQAIEEKFAAKAAVLKTKQAKSEKKAAIIQAQINTAIGVTKALGSAAPPLNFILAGIVSALGTIQTLAIAAQPIPQFAKGTNYSPGGVAELGERGRELVQNPSGEVWMAENRGLYNLQQGSKVLTNQKTEAILNDGRMVQELRLTRKAIQRQPRQRNESQFSKRQRGYRDGYLASKNRLN